VEIAIPSTMRKSAEISVSIALKAMEIAAWADPAIERSSLRRFLVPMERITQIETIKSVCPSLSRIYHMKYSVPIGCIAWSAGAVLAFLNYFDVYRDVANLRWWVGCALPISLITLPVVLTYSALNRKMLFRLCSSFVAIFIVFFTLVMQVTLCITWRDFPSKVVSLVAATPSFLLATFIGAHPESGRGRASLFVVAFFFLSLIGFQVGIMYRLMELDDETVNLTGAWHFKLTDVTKEAIVFILIPFGVKNLMCVERASRRSPPAYPRAEHLRVGGGPAQHGLARPMPFIRTCA
jgi:hypothetical protein